MTNLGLADTKPQKPSVLAKWAFNCACTMQKSESNFAVEAAQGDRSYASIEEAAAHAVQLQAELTAEREMHQQARGAMTELHLSNAALGEALKETQQQLKQAKGAAGMNKKRRFLMTYMDPVVVLEQHLLQEKSRALDATVVGLREEILALQCQKDGNTQVRSTVDCYVCRRDKSMTNAPSPVIYSFYTRYVRVGKLWRGGEAAADAGGE